MVQPVEGLVFALPVLEEAHVACVTRHRIRRASSISVAQSIRGAVGDVASLRRAARGLLNLGPELFDRAGAP